MSPVQGGVFSVEKDKALVLDTDSFFHYSQRVGPAATVQQVQGFNMKCAVGCSLLPTGQPCYQDSGPQSGPCQPVWQLWIQQL